MYKLLIFGHGGLWSVIKENIDFKKAKIVAFINSDLNQAVRSFEGSPIITPDKIKLIEYDFIILASGQYDNLKAQIESLEVPDNKIIAFKLNESKLFASLQSEVNENLKREGNHSLFELFSKREVDDFHLCNMNLLGRNRRISFHDKSVDYIRLSSLELIAEEIYANQVSGNVAELGVYKGEFSKHINAAFPDRKLYLFDTFAGFDTRDVSIDLANQFSIQTNQFADTEVESVLNKMPYSENVILRKGYFPQTSIGIEDKFAFVSIDTDLYKPIYDGLTFFYPRLTKRGYIFIHDYNNFIFKGAREAVRQFCSEQNIPYVPISDNQGTVIISK
ncbi:TylF/MycF/NovP-related O-methyltransferase [Paenibacillus lutrae]|nr:TylF/MycF/NovP-related O-methyltransferase [Paenibacillus lutrae]